ncbi:hypothetical protein [Streptomyces lanatus]|uniref:ABC transporter permease n=1 Tax=Streptomyces lanatus TaxID=66900 RepID=A0ABV1Y4A8_9ACTN|nr:hypothetical protein [Streptomyces lanatus]GHH28158.1 hypothetical protein GCM10018780_84380 [Streptomyces lanatus]
MSTAIPALGGLNRTVLRVHRTALVFWVLAVTAAAAALIWMYVIGDEARGGIAACVSPPRDGGPSCAEIGSITADERYTDGIRVVTELIAYLMFPIAAWAGGVLVGRELESGTARLAWTQSVTPARWLATRLAVPAVLITAGISVLVALILLARGDGDPGLVGHWYQSEAFVSTGPTAVGHALAGLSLGALCGLLLGRALPAAGLSFAACLVLYNGLDRVREHLWPTATHTATDARTFQLPREALAVEWTYQGDRIVGATYHPPSHFRPIQYVETGILLALAAAATLAAFAVLRRRTP